MAPIDWIGPSGSFISSGDERGKKGQFLLGPVLRGGRERIARESAVLTPLCVVLFKFVLRFSHPRELPNGRAL
jgi:hypothetical protein